MKSIQAHYNETTSVDLSEVRILIYQAPNTSSEHCKPSKVTAHVTVDPYSVWKSIAHMLNHKFA